VLELNNDNIISYAMDRGLVANGISSETLSNTARNRVFRLYGGDFNVVVKQMCESSEQHKAHFIRELSSHKYFINLLGINSVPELIYEDEENQAYLMQGAPRSAESWKKRLLFGTIDPTLCSIAGQYLKTIHSVSNNDPNIPNEFWDSLLFETKRIKNNVEAVIKKNPNFTKEINEVAEDLMTLKEGIVHGDFIPDNFLVTQESLILLDFEVVHIGQFAFDVATFLNQFALLAVQAPEKNDLIREGVQEFVNAYGELPLGFMPCLGAQMLFSVDGLTPEKQLLEGQAAVVRQSGLWILQKEIKSLVHLFDNLEALAKS